MPRSPHQGGWGDTEIIFAPLGSRARDATRSPREQHVLFLFCRISSFSSPYFGHALEDLQESPKEDVNKVKLPSSRYSLARLFGFGGRDCEVPAAKPSPVVVSQTETFSTENAPAMSASAHDVSSGEPLDSSNARALLSPPPPHPRVAQLVREASVDEAVPRESRCHVTDTAERFPGNRAKSAAANDDFLPFDDGETSSSSLSNACSIVVSQEDNEDSAASSSDDEDQGIVFVARGPGPPSDPSGQDRPCEMLESTSCPSLARSDAERYVEGMYGG